VALTLGETRDDSVRLIVLAFDDPYPELVDHEDVVMGFSEAISGPSGDDLVRIPFSSVFEHIIVVLVEGSSCV
jgi:hypothetical protein